MDSSKILEYLPVSIYLAKYKITQNTFEIIDFNIIKNSGFTGFTNEELDKKTILKGFDKNEINNFIAFAKTLSINRTFSIKYHFKGKNGKIFYFKDYITVLEIKNNIYTFLGVLTDISSESQLSQIFETVLKSPIIGVLVYKEKIILANDALKNILEIDNKIYDLSVVDLFPEKIKPMAENAVKRRLKGEKFSNFQAFEFKTFKDKRIFTEFFADTIIYEGSYAGLVFVVNKTKFYKNKILLNMIVIVNSLIVDINNEKLLLKEIRNKLEETDYFAQIRLNERLDSKEIEINNEFEKNGFKSYLYLPIIINDKVIASYTFYSVYKNDFSEEVISTLKDIQKKIVLALKNIKNQKNLIILNSAIDKSYQWLIITDKEGIIRYVNTAVEEISGYEKKELMGNNPKIFKSGLQDREFYKNMWQTILSGKIFNGTIINKKKNGDLFYLKDKIIPVKIEDETYFVSLGVDITKEKLLEKEITSIKYRDKLTNLHNRDAFLLNGSKKLKENGNFALFVIDIEDFKLLNETKGYKYGDYILEEFAKFLKDIFYKDDLIARLGNDDFAVLMEYDNLKTLSSVLNKLLEKIKQKKEDIPIEVNIGISIYPKDANDIEKLMEKAYIALSFQKKMKEGNYYKFYNENITFEIENYIKVKNLINRAFEKKEFIYYYQPYVNVKTLEFSGAESLLRIKKENEIIAPNVFIDYAEKSGIIKNIENLMIKELIKAVKSFCFPFSFNLSGISLKDENHIKHLINISKKYAEFITIEITERELIEDLEQTKKIFSLFKNKGYKIAIDDFGTGYSSLTYISNIPIDILKIDISFIKNIIENKKDYIIVDTIIDFAKKLNLKTVAEGIEKKEQIEILKNLGCDYLQGYYFAKPMPLNELNKLIF